MAPLLQSKKQRNSKDISNPVQGMPFPEKDLFKESKQ
jgi:hypothetical protein